MQFTTFCRVHLNFKEIGYFEKIIIPTWEHLITSSQKFLCELNSSRTLLAKYLISVAATLILVGIVYVLTNKGCVIYYYYHYYYYYYYYFKLRSVPALLIKLKLKQSWTVHWLRMTVRPILSYIQKLSYKNFSRILVW